MKRWNPARDHLSFPGYDPRCTRTWAEINLSALAVNSEALQAFAGPSSEIMAVVKADGYGHGATMIARKCAQHGVRHFGVATVEEGKSLRRAGTREEIYVFSPFLPAEAIDIVRADLIPLVSSTQQIQALTAAAQTAPLPARCFLTIDTGMGREGCLPDEAASIWAQLNGDSAAQKNLRITGLATHLSSADDLEAGESVSHEQVERFFALADALAERGELDRVDDGRGGRGVFLTIANSPGALRLRLTPLPRGARGYLMRAGLLTYGIEPYADAFATIPDLRPILSWRARITLLRDLPAGSPIGYGQTYFLTRDSRIGTLGVGYADGLSRRLSNRGHALFQGHRFPIVGRVSMDQCQVDFTDAASDVVVGDVVTLIGVDGTESTTVLQTAETIGTTPHEPTCALSARVPRIYLD